MESIENQILKSITNHKRGKIFFPVNFIKFGSSTAVRQALNRLEDKKKIVRVAKGIYLYPKTSKRLGVIYPTLNEIALAIAKRDKARIIPTGLYALNQLGLSTQIPTNFVYITDGSPRNIKVYNSVIKFKKVSPKQLSLSNDRFIMLVQALRELSIENIDPAVDKIVTKHILGIDIKEFEHDIKLVPDWIRKYLTKLRNEKVVCNI